MSMRQINRIVLHCTATPQTTTVQSILNYWYKVKKWKSPGYHFLIKPDGEVVDLLPVDKVSNGSRGFNHDSIHISYIGGVDDENNPIDNRTHDQKQSMIALISNIRMNSYYSQIPIVGHRDLPDVTKACPSFDVGDWLKSICG